MHFLKRGILLYLFVRVEGVKKCKEVVVYRGQKKNLNHIFLTIICVAAFLKNSGSLVTHIRNISFRRKRDFSSRSFYHHFT